METTLASGLNELDAYYKENHLRPNPAKTQLTAFHLKNRHADRKLNVTWNGTKLDHTNSPVYLGITLDRSLTYRNHCMKTRAKLSSRNNLLMKLHGTNWGACPHIMRTTATAHSQNERTKQLTDQRHSLHRHQPVKSRLHYARTTLVVTLMCSFRILSLLVTPHIHLSILISFTSSRASCPLVVAQVSAPYNRASLTTVL